MRLHPDTQVPAYSETFHCFPSCVYYTVIIFLQSMIASQKQLRFGGTLYTFFGNEKQPSSYYYKVLSLKKGKGNGLWTALSCLLNRDSVCSYSMWTKLESLFIVFCCLCHDQTFIQSLSVTWLCIRNRVLLNIDSSNAEPSLCVCLFLSIKYVFTKYNV